MNSVIPAGSDIWVPAILLMVGIAGIVIPVIPGLLIAVLGVLLWAWQTGTTTSWIVFAIVLVVYAVGLSLQYLLPGRRLKRDGVGTSTLLLAVALGIVGFFVIPVVGGPLGFVLGIYLVEHARSRDRAQAWTRTKSALKAVLLSVGIELIAGLIIAATWIVGVILTRS